MDPAGEKALAGLQRTRKLLMASTWRYFIGLLGIVLVRCLYLCCNSLDLTNDHSRFGEVTSSGTSVPGSEMVQASPWRSSVESN